MTTTSRRRSTVLRTFDETSVRHWDEIEDVWSVFADEADLLRAVQQRWFASLAASLDHAIEEGGRDLLHDVRSAYRDAVRRHPGLRRVLDDHAGHPAIARAVRREHALLAQAAGVAHSHLVTRDAERQATWVPTPRQSTFARFLSFARD